MTDTVWLTIDWREAEVDTPDTQQEIYTETLFHEVNRMDEVEQAARVPDANVPDGGMGAAWLWSILTAEVSIENLKRLGQEVQARLPGKPISFSFKRSKDGDVEFSMDNVRPDEFSAKLDELVAAAKALADKDQP